jgi:putative addiction module component (TIGR02574 family)
MNKIDEAWTALKKLPPEEQERLAEAILDLAAHADDLQLDDEQVAEIDRRVRDTNAKTLSLNEFRELVGKLGT